MEKNVFPPTDPHLSNFKMHFYVVLSRIIVTEPGASLLQELNQDESNKSCWIGFSQIISPRKLSWWIWVLVKYPALVLHYPGGFGRFWTNTRP